MKKIGTSPAAASGERVTGDRRPVSAAQLAKNPPGWRPIKTAPKNGKHILLFCRFEKPEIAIARWRPEKGAAPGPHGRFVWQERGYGGTIAEQCATHWMPLPPPPENTGEAS